MRSGPRRKKRRILGRRRCIQADAFRTRFRSCWTQANLRTTSVRKPSARDSVKAHSPCTTRCLNRPCAAMVASRWSGLVSPERFANANTSASANVRRQETWEPTATLTGLPSVPCRRRRFINHQRKQSVHANVRACGRVPSRITGTDAKQRRRSQPAMPVEPGNPADERHISEE
jgi:hypothetical protein